MAVDISESSWKAFIKKQKLEGQLEDKDLLKALARFDKTDERKPEPRLEALQDLIKEVPKQITALVKQKKKLGDKPFGLVKDELYGILDEAEKLQKKTQAAVDAEAKEAKDAKAGKDDEGDGEDEPGSALLDPKRLVAQLKQCQRTPDRTVQFAYLDPASKEQPAVLAMHPKMSSTSLFNKLKKETGGRTGAYGSAWVDGTSLMLQLDKPLGGLVKKVRAAVKAAGFRVAKVVLWQEDGTVFEQDDEPDKDGDGAAEPMVGAPGGPAAKSIPPAPPGGPAAKAAAPAPPTASPEAAAFMARLKALLARAAEFGDPALAQQAKLLGSEAGVALRKGESARVDQLMKQAEGLFETAKAIPPAPPGGPAAKTPAAKAATPAAAPVSPEAAAFTARLKALLDKAAAFGDPALVQQAKLLGSEAGVALRKGEAAQVDKLMKQAEALFANAKAASATPAAQPANETARPAAPKSDEELAAAWQARFETTEKVYLEVMERPPGDAAKLRALMDFATGKAKDKQYASAAQTLDRLDGMLAKVQPATTPKAGEAKGERGYKGLVAYRTSLLEFRKAAATVDAQIASLKAAIPSQLPEESDLADELSKELGELTKSLLDAVDEAMNTSENVDSPIVDAMADRLQAYADELQSSELVEHVDNNPFGVSMSVQKTLMGALSSIQRNWPVPA